jgi:RHS repeat-associated protein
MYTGALLSQQRYREAPPECPEGHEGGMPFGEVRTEIGTITQTDFSFTGQRSISMLSIMDYIARFYDPSIGRFVQPDSIVPSPANPQSWNRYSYVNNNPVRYMDPTGHRCVEEGFEGSCSNVELKITKKYVAESNRSDFEKDVLENLLKAGKKGRHIYEYLVLDNVQIGFHSHLYAGAYWDERNNAIYLNMDRSKASADDPFVLNLVAHEATHLEQTPTLALTKFGELEAWKEGFTVQSYFSPLKEGRPEYKIVNDLEIWDTYKFTELVHEYNENVPRGWIYNLFFDLLPDWRRGVQFSVGR